MSTDPKIAEYTPTKARPAVEGMIAEYRGGTWYRVHYDGKPLTLKMVYRAFDALKTMGISHE